MYIYIYISIISLIDAHCLILSTSSDRHSTDVSTLRNHQINRPLLSAYLKIDLMEDLLKGYSCLYVPDLRYLI